MQGRNLLALVAWVVLAAARPGASQTHQDLFATTVPASACQPASPIMSDRLSLVNGAWVLNDGFIGVAQLWCPLPVNAYTVSDDSFHNQMIGYRIFYRDSDGGLGQSQVTVRLGYRTASGFAWAGPLWISNLPQTGNTTEFHPTSHDLGANLYSFYVTMARTNANVEPVFAGIDFNTLN